MMPASRRPAHPSIAHALRAVNKELVGLYWDIGRLIVERQQSEGWGKAVVAQLAADLQAAFPGTGGFSASNPWRMKSFFETYSGAGKLAPLVREIGWSHNLIILERCGDAQEREFYLRMTRKFGWSKNVLAHQIDNQSYEKYLLGPVAGRHDQVAFSGVILLPPAGPAPATRTANPSPSSSG